MRPRSKGTFTPCTLPARSPALRGQLPLPPCMPHYHNLRSPWHAHLHASFSPVCRLCLPPSHHPGSSPPLLTNPNQAPPQVAAVHLFHEAFSVENDMLTPTFKLKRPQAQARFQDVLADMYSKLPEV